MNTLLLTACLAMSPAAPALPEDAPLALQGPVATESPVPAATPAAGVPESALPSASALMVEQMEDYLDAERAESRLFVGLGALSLAGGAVALASDRPALQGASLPVMGVGLIQLLVGGSVWWRTEDQKRALRTQIGEAPARYVADETQRMKTVNDNFVIYRWTELSLLGAGAALGATGYALDREFVTGLGLGLAVQSAIMLGLDYFAERRGHAYARQVGAFQF
jgi:hypothetical protein